MLKRVIVTIGLLVLFIGQAHAVHAGGVAMIPPVQDNGTWATRLYISNITDSEVYMYIYLWNRDGVLVKDTGGATGGNIRLVDSTAPVYDEAVSDATIEIAIAPKNTIRIDLEEIIYHGHGKIEWCGGAAGPALMAHAVAVLGTSISYDVAINHGSPF